jgi:hypothetical protein
MTMYCSSLKSISVPITSVITQRFSFATIGFHHRHTNSVWTRVHITLCSSLFFRFSSERMLDVRVKLHLWHPEIRNENQNLSGPTVRAVSNVTNLTTTGTLLLDTQKGTLRLKGGE